MKRSAPTSTRDMSPSQLHAAMEAINGLAPPSSDADLAAWAEYEVVSGFLLEARSDGSPDEIKRDATEWLLRNHAFPLEMLIPHIERAIGRNLSPEEISGERPLA